MGAPLLAYVQNIVQEVGVCLQSVGDARKYCLRAGASYCGRSTHCLMPRLTSRARRWKHSARRVRAEIETPLVT